MTSDQERAAPAQQPVASKPLRYCDYCKSWYSKPCGAGCVWRPDMPTELPPSPEPELRAEIARLTRERDELRSYAHDATRAITSLTVGGSEFFGRKIGDMYTADLPFCVEHVRDRERRAHDRHIQAISEKRAAESRVEALSAEVGKLTDALENIATLNRSRDQLQEMARAALDNGATT